MKCPVDDETLVMADRNGVEIDYCPKCRGVWLDRGELDKIIERAAAPSTGSQDARRSERRDERRSDDYRDDRRDERRDERRDDYHRDDDRRYYSDEHRGGRKRESFLSDLFDF